MSNGRQLYSQLVKICEDYLGPAGERFMRRQVETHLAIQPEEIQPKHIPQLVDWMRLMFTRVTNDSQVVDDFTERIRQLSIATPTKSATNSRR